MKKLFISTLCLMLFHLCYGQNKFEEGFIITLSGDTVHGVVKDRKEGIFSKLYEKVRFKQGNKKAIKKYKANQIRAYAIGDQVFESVNKNTLHDGFLSGISPSGNLKDRVFLKVIIKGVASYYQQEWVEQESGIIEAIDYVKKENNPIYIRSTQGLFGLKKRKLSAYFSDCPPLQLKIKNKELVTSLEVVQFYNDWILQENN